MSECFCGAEDYCKNTVNVLRRSDDKMTVMTLPTSVYRKIESCHNKWPEATENNFTFLIKRKGDKYIVKLPLKARMKIMLKRIKKFWQ